MHENSYVKERNPQVRGITDLSRLESLGTEGYCGSWVASHKNQTLEMDFELEADENRSFIECLILN